jgi:hypothetical protein
VAALTASVPLLVAAACGTNPTPPTGSCVTAPTPLCDVVVDGGPSDIGLVGYSCTGTARPDDHSSYVEGIPGGVLCANKGDADAGSQTYCCTDFGTPCAYNPVAICNPGYYGYQCRGGTRPESWNPAIACDNGFYEGHLVDYCCSGTPTLPGCIQSDSAQTPDGGACSGRLLGWICNDNSLPEASELGVSKSRADTFYLLCPTPTPAANPGHNYYCCYVPALPPPGASCIQDTAVPGCQPGRFGFACYDRDTPEEDYPPMHCPAPGVPGKSSEGYSATLYCCDFQ